MINKLELKVGIFLILSSLLIAAAIGYVAYKKGFFAKFSTYTLAAKSGDDLSEGMPVVFSGFKIGTVSALELSKDGSVLIKIKIPEVHVKWIRLDSNFIVNKPLIGSARILVVTDNMQSPPLSPGQVPEVVNISEINETIKQARPLLDKVSEIANNVERLTARLADPGSDTQKILANAQKLTARLADPGSDIYRILANAEKVTANLAQKDALLEMVVSDKTSIASFYAAMNKTKDITSLLEATLQKLDRMALKTDDMIYGAEGSLPTVNKALRDVLSKLQKLDATIDNINKISADATGSTVDLKLLRNQLDAAVDSLGDLINDVDKIIPFKKAPEIKLP